MNRTQELLLKAEDCAEISDLSFQEALISLKDRLLLKGIASVNRTMAHQLLDLANQSVDMPKECKFNYEE